MVLLAFPPVVPEAVYRIRSAARANPDLYLEWQSDNEVKPVELKADSKNQKWKVAAQQDDTYTVTNVGSGAALCIKFYDEDGQQKQRLYAGSVQYWTLEPRGDEFVIGVPDNAFAVDLANNNWVILWQRNGLQHQRWVLDSVEATPPGGNPGSTGTTGTTETTGITGPICVGSPLASGAYNIKNRTTDGEVCVWTDYKRDYAPLLMWPATSGRVYDARAWKVQPLGDGTLITNSYGGLGPRAIRDGPFVNTAPNTCRLIPVAGTHYYHIALSTDSCARVLRDQNPVGAVNQEPTTAEFNKDDMRQHWEFSPAH